MDIDKKRIIWENNCYEEKIFASLDYAVITATMYSCMDKRVRIYIYIYIYIYMPTSLCSDQIYN